MQDFNEIKDVFKTGIYKITCLTNGKVYVGSACSTDPRKSKRGFRGRWYQHLQHLNKSTHRNHYLQSCWNKYGEKNFSFEILELCDKANAKEKEEFWISAYKADNNEFGFNVIKSHLAFYGQFSDDHRSRISASLTGKPRTEALKKKLGVAVIQFDLEGNELNRFYSMTEAYKITGVQRADIGQACIGRKLKTAGGFIWKKDTD